MNCAALLASIDDTRLTTVERVVFGNIVKGYQTRAEIAKATGCAESSVPRAVRKLESLGYLKRHFHDGKANTFEVLPQADTGISRDTGITRTRTKKTRGITATTGVSPPADTGLEAIEDAEFVDNSAAHIEHAAACGRANLKTTTSELYPETVELDYNNSRASAQPAKVLNGSARGMNAQQLAAVVFEHVNSSWLDPNRSHGLATSAGTLASLIKAGADFDLDVLPTIKRMVATKREHIRSFGFFEDAIRTATARRLAAEATRNPITALEAFNDKPSTRNHSYASAGRGRARSVETEILMRDIAGDPSEPVR